MDSFKLSCLDDDEEAEDVQEENDDDEEVDQEEEEKEGEYDEENEEDDAEEEAAEEEEEEDEEEMTELDKELEARLQKLPRRNIILSATLAKSTGWRKKFKGKKKKNSKEKEEEKDLSASIKGVEEGERNYKLEVLLDKIQFNGKPKLIDLTRDAMIPDTLTEYKSFCTDEEKPMYLYNFLMRNPEKSCIIFCNSIPGAKKVASLLNLLNISSLCLHSEMQQKQRLKKLEQFTDGRCKVIVCTDVAARGLDIPNVELVVHYQIPKDSDTYIHRSGRTARIGKEGVTYALVGPKDQGEYKKVCNYLGRYQGISNIELNAKELAELSQYVHAATKVEHSSFLIQKKKKESEWYVKHAKRADIELDDTIRQELTNLEEEVHTKKKVILNERKDYVKAKTDLNKFSEANKRKKVFLDPAKISQLNTLMHQQGVPENTNNNKGNKGKLKRQMNLNQFLMQGNLQMGKKPKVKKVLKSGKSKKYWKRR